MTGTPAGADSPRGAQASGADGEPPSDAAGVTAHQARRPADRAAGGGMAGAGAGQERGQAEVTPPVPARTPDATAGAGAPEERGPAEATPPVPARTADGTPDGSGAGASRRPSAPLAGRVGRIAARHPCWVLGGWALLAAAGCALVLLRLGDFGAPVLSVPGSQSARAAALVDRGMPSMGTEQMVLAFTSRTLPADSPAYQRAESAAASALVGVAGAGGMLPLPPTPGTPTAAARHHAYLVLGMTGDQQQRESRLPAVQRIADRGAEAASGGRVTVSLTGVTPVFTALARSDLDELRFIEAGTVPVALLLLLLGMGSLGSALVPLLSAGAGIAVSLGSVALVGLVQPVDTIMLTVATTVGFGLGMDYALLIVLRYRDARRSGLPPYDAAHRSAATAGRAVSWCAVAVLTTAAALLTVPLEEVRGIAYAALATTAVTLAAALTLLPALLPRADRWLAAGTVRRRRADAGELWRRWAHHLMRHPWPYLLCAVAVLLLAAVPVTGIRLGMRVDRASIAGSPAGQGLARMEADHLASVTLIALPHPVGAPVDTTALVERLDADPRVALVAPLDNGRDLTVLEVGERYPADGPTAAALARTIRAEAPRLLPAGQRVLTGGPAATLLDLRSAMITALWQVGAIVLAASFLLLLVLFRSLLIPLKAIVMNVLAVGAAFGLLTLVVQRGAGGEINSVIPLLALTMVFGLSMDYEVFLVHRIAEHYRRTGDNRAAVAHGLSRTAQPITLAAQVLAAVFAGLMVSSRQELRQEGFAVAAAVFLDATVIRMVLVPTLMRLLGERNWWLPAPLSRLLPPLGPSARPPAAAGPPDRADPHRADSDRADSAGVDPDRATPAAADPAGADPDTADPDTAGPRRAGPDQAAGTAAAR